ncbi:MAG: pseudouridine-5'-phosphate glycosidase [Saprospiraceae bacterium]
MHPNLHIAPQITEAIRQGMPVVALESTIITHGMPFPQNVETALLVEQTLRHGDAIPATIALLDGAIRVGLSPAEIERLGQTGNQARKVSRRDIALTLAKKQTGATTVAATMLIAHMAGIRIFATGGIGGVHREAPQSFDISADLRELAHTPVAVVCAGAKSILDLPLTLEYLETAGVPIVGYQTDEFPAFFSRHSGLPVDGRADTPSELAAVLTRHWALPQASGIIVANPIPKEMELAFPQMEEKISEALKAAQKEGIKGKAITPYLLAYLEKATAGASLKANIGLVLNNARLAAELARALCQV